MNWALPVRGLLGLVSLCLGCWCCYRVNGAIRMGVSTVLIFLGLLLLLSVRW